MKSFDNILLISDIDGTVVNRSDWSVSEENQEAVKFFIDYGGKFTFATGRNPSSIRTVKMDITPNVPIITHNGAAIFDFNYFKPHNDKLLWQNGLNNKCEEIIKEVSELFPESGIDVFCNDEIYAIKEAENVKRIEEELKIRIKEKNVNNIPRPFLKVLFFQSCEQTDSLIKHIESKPYYNDFHFVRSEPIFYEMLNPTATKWNALNVLRSMLPSKMKVISVGDNENDVELIKNSDIGFAVGNAEECAKAVADHVTVRQEENALAEVIKML